MYKVAIIGLGNIGFQLNMDYKRRETWSHVAAYEKCRRTELIGAVDINDEKVKIFRQHYRNIPVFKTIKELMKDRDIDIVSICTPTGNHYSVLKELLKYPIKGIFCEKPIASTIAEAREMIKMCRDKKVVLAINHTRRWDGNYLFVKKMIQDGKIGRIKAVNAFYPGQVFNIGTHLFDTICMLIQKNPETVSGMFLNLKTQDPTVSGWIQFNEQIPCTVVSTGRLEDLIFEVDILGDEGRIRIIENGEKIEWYSFSESLRYSRYRELFLKPIKINQNIKKDRFVEAIFDIIAVIEGKKKDVNCTGKDGLYSMAISLSIFESSKKYGTPIKVDGLEV